MNILTFLEHYRKPDFFTQKPVICLYGCPEYPSLFFNIIQPSIMHPRESLDVSAEDINRVMASLQMSFLGSRTLYWLRGIDGLADKTKTSFLRFMATYEGPHTIIFFTAAKPEAGFVHTVELPDTVDKKLCMHLLEHASLEAYKKSYFVTALFNRVESVSLDQAYGLMRYIRCMGAHTTKDDIDRWLNGIVVPERSLFTLSQHFFAKDSRSFFMLWAQLEKDYPESFWIAFWSEQVWRTYNFVRLMHEKQFAQAKSITFRLPFSVIQRDWKKLSLVELQKAHHALYQADYALKNGGSSYGLELMYSKFMVGEYKE